VHTTLLAQYPEPFQRWSLANIWLGKPSRPGRWGRPSAKNKGNLDVGGGARHRPFWTCFSLKNRSDLDIKYTDSRRVCMWHKTGAYRPFSTFENGHVCMCTKKVCIVHSRPSKTDMFSVHRGPSLTKMVSQIVTRVVNYTQNVKFHAFSTKRGR
jgi:hypothetical protein